MEPSGNIQPERRPRRRSADRINFRGSSSSVFGWLKIAFFSFLRFRRLPSFNFEHRLFGVSEAAESRPGINACGRAVDTTAGNGVTESSATFNFRRERSPRESCSRESFGLRATEPRTETKSSPYEPPRSGYSFKFPGGDGNCVPSESDRFQNT